MNHTHSSPPNIESNNNKNRSLNLNILFLLCLLGIIFALFPLLPHLLESLVVSSNSILKSSFDISLSQIVLFVCIWVSIFILFAPYSPPYTPPMSRPSVLSALPSMPGLGPSRRQPDSFPSNQYPPAGTATYSSPRSSLLTSLPPPRRSADTSPTVPTPDPYGHVSCSVWFLFISHGTQPLYSCILSPEKDTNSLLWFNSVSLAYSSPIELVPLYSAYYHWMTNHFSFIPLSCWPYPP